LKFTSTAAVARGKTVETIEVRVMIEDDNSDSKSEPRKPVLYFRLLVADCFEVAYSGGNLLQATKFDGMLYKICDLFPVIGIETPSCRTQTKSESSYRGCTDRPLQWMNREVPLHEFAGWTE
jgi:hypothetical protein